MARGRKQNKANRPSMEKQSISGPLAFGQSSGLRPGYSPDAGGLDHGESQNQLRHLRGWVASAVRAIAKRVAGAKLCVAVKSRGPRTRKSAGDDLEPLESHPLLDAFDDPNPLMVRFNLISLIVIYFEICGLAYLWLRRDEETDQLQLWPLPPHWVRNKGSHYEVRPDGAPEPFNVPDDEMAVFSLPHPLNPYGSVFSPLASQADVVGVDEAILGSQAQAFQQGIRPSIIARVAPMEAPGHAAVRRVLTPEQRKQLIQAIRNAYSGVMNHHDPFIIDGIVEGIEKFSLSPSEMDWLDSAKWTRSRILTSFGVNPLILGEIEGANRAQAVVAEQNFCDNVVNPLLELLGQCITEWIAKPYFGDNTIAYFEPAVARDVELELQRWKLAVQSNLVTPNEYRRAVLNLPDIEGGDELRKPPATPMDEARDELEKSFADYDIDFGDGASDGNLETK